MESALRKWSADAGPVEFRETVPEIAPESRIGSSAVEEFRPEEKAEMQSVNRDGKAFSEAPGSAHGASNSNGRAGKEDFAFSDEPRWDGETAEQPQPPKPNLAADYYELLQISRNADMETIHRVYRIMAARFHPDNPRTGDAERFLLLTQAYRVLSDPARRSEYDAVLINQGVNPMPVFQLKDFVDGIDGEVNRRLGVLSLLYHRRRMNPSHPGLSVLDLENRMSFPREYLTFTLWYLRSKGFIAAEDNSDYCITPTGIDFVEENSSTNRIIRELLTDGSPQSAEELERAAAAAAAAEAEQARAKAAEEQRRRPAQGQSESRRKFEARAILRQSRREKTDPPSAALG